MTCSLHNGGVFSGLEAGVVLALSLVLLLPAIVNASTAGQVNIATQNESAAHQVAPGEPLVFSVKLLNFGLNSRADVVITYQISTAAGKAVYHQTETVAVETTATFVKRLPVPKSLAAGNYILQTEIVYSGQTAVAVSQFDFEVIKTMAGLPQKTFYYLAATMAGLILVLGAGLFWLRRQWAVSKKDYVFDYAAVPVDDRRYYQLISESIAQMRRLAGQDAINLAANIPGLKVNPKTGEVLSLTSNPTVVINSLVLRYETLLGRNLQESLAQTQHNQQRKVA